MRHNRCEACRSRILFVSWRMMRRWSDYVRDCGQPLTSRRKRDVRCAPTPCRRAVVACNIRTYPMNISKAEQHMRSAEHPSELQSLMRISYAVFCLQKEKRIPLSET